MNMRRQRHRLIIIMLPMSQLTLRMIRQIIRPPRIPLRPRTRTASMYQPHRPKPHHQLLNSHRSSKRPLMNHHVRLLRRHRHVRILPTPRLVQNPLTILTQMIRMRRQNSNICTRTIRIVVLRPMRNINRRRIARLNTARIRGMNTPIKLLAPSEIQVLMRQHPIRTHRHPLILKRIH